MSRTVHPVIALHLTQAPAAPAEGACGHCGQSASGPVCRVELRQPDQLPQLQGNIPRLSRLLEALAPALQGTEDEQGTALHLNQIVHAFKLDEALGEAELVLAVAPRCGGMDLAERAFQVLRQHLPDTDLYVRHLPARPPA
ncbi:hypothetical protein [Ideonella livida]|uniref:Uncharacterized protein n=1 Tax=Ideonella livida TaxID=2707176 RepID=A0A7C9TM59_9BURK|nr:hypothetical protein [Ideonella livida]NDY93082.1 hypothetical protein [Ideonella livida]